MQCRNVNETTQYSEFQPLDRYVSDRRVYVLRHKYVELNEWGCDYVIYVILDNQ